VVSLGSLLAAFFSNFSISFVIIYIQINDNDDDDYDHDSNDDEKLSKKYEKFFNHLPPITDYWLFLFFQEVLKYFLLH